MRRKSLILSITAILMSVLLLQGCNAGSYINVAGKTYTYEYEPESGLEFDRFRISLNSDGTYTYFERIYSSYLGIGNWSVNGDVLTLTDDDEIGYPLKNSFRIDGNDLIFLEDGSTNFIYVKVGDGERFTGE